MRLLQSDAAELRSSVKVRGALEYICTDRSEGVRLQSIQQTGRSDSRVVSTVEKIASCAGCRGASTHAGEGPPPRPGAALGGRRCRRAIAGDGPNKIQFCCNSV